MNTIFGIDGQKYEPDEKHEIWNEYRVVSLRNPKYSSVCAEVNELSRKGWVIVPGSVSFGENAVMMQRLTGKKL